MKRTAMTRSTSLRRDTGEARLSVPAPVTRKCKACKEPYLRLRPLQVACSPRCAQVIGEARAAKERAAAASADRRLTREKREALKPRSAWLKEAEAAVNRYVRLRDAAAGCISCHLPAAWGGQWHASHFRSVGAASAVRFNLWNIHKACSPCNAHKGGNIIEYRPRLIEKIGADRVEWLMSQNGRADYSIEYLKRLKAVFAKKARRLERRLA